MFDPVKLERLKQAAERDDWNTASDVCLELSLAAQGTNDLFYIEAIWSAVRLRETKHLSSMILEIKRRTPN